MEELKKLGLENREILAYLTLLKLGETTAIVIAEKTNIDRATIYRILEKLIGRGFVSFVIKNNVKYFSACEPKRLLTYIKETEKEISRILPKLEKLKKAEEAETIVQVYKGKEGGKTVLKDIITTGKDYGVFGYEGQFRRIFPKIYLDQYMRDLKKKGMTERVLIKKGIKVNKYNQVKIKYLPKNFSSPSTTVVYGNKIAHVVWTEPYFIIVVENKEIAKSYKNYFKSMWKIAKPSH